MSQFKELFSVSDPWYVKSIMLARDFCGGQLSLELSLSDDSSAQGVRLERLRDEDVVPALLSADQITISEEIGSQCEYGKVRVECFGESYLEFWCDSYARMA
ncbi:hypothetical protein [uncultured Spongiibacter sp.]|uniref:hypothetical protein n=1 Tax=Alcanivorax sp. IL2 TaxID=3396310 RepID=UPI00259A338E|nr:hypothetical protein [uncultured Spongiibacter sp.]